MALCFLACSIWLLPQTSELGEISYKKEPTENITTWVYEDGSYTPIAKLINGQRYSIVSDYIGRPVQCFDDTGEVVWETDYDIYGRLKDLKGERCFIPFRQMGQYEDEELGGLYYNRFRYYDSGSGVYISQDPIGLHSGQFNFYAYVEDSNSLVDIFGLKCSAAQRRANKLNGKKAEQLVLNKLLTNPNVVVLQEQVFIRTPGLGRGRYADILIQNKQTGKFINVEVKSGGAVRSSTQIAKDKLINSGQGIFGKNAPQNMLGDELAGTAATDIITSVKNVGLWQL